MLQRKPDRTELHQPGCVVVEQAARFVDVCDRVDMDIREIAGNEIDQSIEDDERCHDHSIAVVAGHLKMVSGWNARRGRQNEAEARVNSQRSGSPQAHG
jgi:hypothetical protein